MYIVYLLVGVMTMSLALPQSVLAVESFGITPPYVINHELEPGEIFEQRIFIVRRDASKELQADISWEVPGADGWLTIDQGESFVLPVGEQRVPMVVRVMVPEDVRAGEYQGTLEVSVRVPEQAAQSGMIAVGLRARAQVDLHVVRDGQGSNGSDQVAAALFGGMVFGWVGGGLAIVFLGLLLLLVRSKWLRRRVAYTTLANHLSVPSRPAERPRLAELDQTRWGG